MRLVRILQLHNHHASLGGAMEVLAHEASFLRQAGHRVEEYSLPPAEQMGLSPLHAGAKAVWNREACRILEERITSLRPYVMHVHTPFPLLSPAVFRTAQRLDVPAVATLHSYRYSCIAGTCFRNGHPCEDCVGKRLKLPGLRHRCYHDSIGASAALTLSLSLHGALGTFSQSVDRFLALTSFSKRLLIRDGVPEAKIVVKPNSVPDPGEPANSKVTQRYVVYVGRLIDVKGIDTLLDAWKLAQNGDVRLRIAGDGELRGLVEQRAEHDPSIDFLGWIDEDDVSRLMAEAEAVVVPSKWYEGAPLVILRSLAVGTPVMVSDLENICAEVLSDQGGISFSVGNADSLAAALTQLAHEPAWFAGMRGNARESYLRRYSPSADLTRLEALYADVLAERG